MRKSATCGSRELLSNMIYMLSGKSGGWLAENDKSSTIRGDDNNKPPKSFSICKQTSYTSLSNINRNPFLCLSACAHSLLSRVR